MTIQVRASRASNDETRLRRVLPLQEDHKAPARLKRPVPHHGNPRTWGPSRRPCPLDGERQSAPACEIDHSERGHLQAAFGTMRTAVEEVPEAERLRTTLRDEGRVMRGDQFRAWVKRRPQHALMKVGPVKRLP